MHFLFIVGTIWAHKLENLIFQLCYDYVKFITIKKGYSIMSAIILEVIKTLIIRITNWGLDFIFTKKNLSETNSLAFERELFIKRIYSIFAYHHIKKEDIPVLLKHFNITLADLAYENKIIKKFNDDVVTYISDIFGINKNWIYGRSSTMIQLPMEHGFYKNSTHFAKILLETNPKRIYILSETIPNKVKDERKENNAICVIAEYHKYISNNQIITTYHLFDESCKYGYWKCRYELKRFLLYIKKAHQCILLEGRATHDLKTKLKIFQEGKIKFSDLLAKSVHWAPENYIFFLKESQSVIYDELDELNKIDEEYDKIEHYV